MALTKGDATCARCQRTYSPEALGDRGFCCICERDFKYETLYGPDWRCVVRAALDKAEGKEGG